MSICCPNFAQDFHTSLETDVCHVPILKDSPLISESSSERNKVQKNVDHTSNSGKFMGEKINQHGSSDLDHTVDGRNPAPVDRCFIPLYIYKVL